MIDLGVPMLDGEVHPAYANPRPEVTVAVPAWATRVLDVGCSVGAMGAVLCERGHHVTGVEYEPALADAARERLDAVVCGDVEAMAATGEDPGGPFDAVVFADVLEHLRDPWRVVQWGAGLLASDGVMVVSVPNVRHLETFWQLAVHRWWPYRGVGIFDRTHLRFFARANLPQLFAGTDLRIREVRRHHAVTLDWASRWNRVAPYLGDLGTLQFVVVASR